jgi:GT2 family glycosyltransferase
MDVSISIVNYKSSELVIKAIESIYNYTDGLKYEIIVTNNSPEDLGFYLIKDHFKNIDIKLIDLKANLGFSKANNKANEIANGKYFLIYNPDMFLIENTIKNCFDFLESHKNYAGCTVKFIYPNGEYQFSGFYKQKGAKTFYGHIPYILNITDTKTLFNQPFAASDKEEIVDIDVACGAFLFLPDVIYKNINGFDQQFFLYGEDWEISNRILKAGKIALLNSTKVIHMHGGTSEVEFNDEKNDLDIATRKGTQMFVSILLWQKKEFGKTVCLKLYGLIMLGLFLSMLGYMKNGFKALDFKKLLSYSKNSVIITKEVFFMLVGKDRVYKTM